MSVEVPVVSVEVPVVPVEVPVVSVVVPVVITGGATSVVIGGGVSVVTVVSITILTISDLSEILPLASTATANIKYSSLGNDPVTILHNPLASTDTDPRSKELAYKNTVEFGSALPKTVKILFLVLPLLVVIVGG